MPKRAHFLACAAAVAMWTALPAAAQDTPSASTVVATVNGTEITLGHMILIRAGLPDQYKQLPDDVLYDGILEQLIQQTALAQAAGEEDSLRARTAIENESRSIRAAEEVEDVANAAVSDEALQALYLERFVNADLGVEFNANHILVTSEEDAKALITEIENGADFETLAQEKSTGPSGPNGGALGWFAEGQMVPEFEAAVATLEPGQVSGPIQTQFGWHVIKLNERRNKEAPAIEAVRDALEQELQQKAVQARIDELVAGAEVTRKAKEEIDTSSLQNLDLLEQ